MSLDDSRRNDRVTEIGNRETFQASATNTRYNVSFTVTGGIPAFYTCFLERRGIKNVQCESLGNGYYKIFATSTRAELREALESQRGVKVTDNEVTDDKPTDQVA
ncbi:MAG: hypothetical protein V1880_04155 [Patescibacteria group bacterium]|nr:hypothetical protein [Pseudomonadota bacterium]